jgi:uncharacterized protein YjaZ
MILQKQTAYKGHTKNAKPQKKTSRRLKKITRWEDVESFQVAQNKFQKPSPSNVIMDIRLTQNAVNCVD